MPIINMPIIIKPIVLITMPIKPIIGSDRISTLPNNPRQFARRLIRLPVQYKNLTFGPLLTVATTVLANSGVRH